ncbi:MAG: LamG-like jellyroll fold domain-containing protein [Phycisphaerales bacterium]
MKTNVLACLAVVGLATSVNAQFQNTYGTATDERAESVINTSDGGYLMAGTRNVNGNLQMYLVKVDANGLFQWDSLFGGQGRDTANRVEELPAAAGGGYIVAGETNSSAAGFGAALVRVGAGGNVVWARSYLGTPFVGGAAGPTGLTVCGNGDFVITSRAQITGFVGQGFVLTRTTAAGAVVFSRVYQDSRFGASTWASLTDVHELADRSLVVTGYTSRQGLPDTDTVLARCDAGGNFFISRTLGPAQLADFGTNLVPGVQNTLFVTGQRQNAAGLNNNSFLFRTDINANLAWYRQYQNFLSNNALEVVDTIGSVVVGGTTANLASNGASMLKVGFAGNFTWCSVYGGPGTDIGESVDVTPAGLLSLSGYTNSWGSGLNDYYLVETNSLGQSSEVCETRIDLPQNDVPPPIVNFQMPPQDRPELFQLPWQSTPGNTRRTDACPTPCVRPPGGMWAWFPFDELAGPRANDIVVNNDGFWSGGPTPTPGVVAGALCYDGVNDLVRVPDAPSIDLGTGDLTIDAWVRTTNANGVQIICDKRVNTPRVVGYSMYLSNGQLGFQLADGAGPSGTCACNLTAACTNWGSGVAGFVADGNWHLVAVTVRRGLATGGTFYVDGVAVGTFNPTCRPGNVDNSSPLIIGRRSVSNDGYFNGCLDELEIFKRALTPAEIMGLFTANAAGKCKDTVATNWDIPFCNGQQQVSTYVTICNNHATPQTYVGSFAGLPSGPGCSVAGPTVINSTTTFPITIPANTCLNIPIVIDRPAGLTAAGLTSCYEFTATNVGTGETLVGHGSVQDRRDLCAVLNPVLIGSTLRVPLDTGVGTTIGFSNTSGGAISGQLRLRVIGPDMEGDTIFVSLNGLPPGEPILRSVNFPAGGNGFFDVFVELAVPDVTTTFTILVEGDLDGDGTFEPLTSFNAQGQYVPPCPGDYNRDGSVDGDDVIAFFSDWDNGVDEADVNEDGSVDGDDVISFFIAWDRGC